MFSNNIKTINRNIFYSSLNLTMKCLLYLCYLRLFGDMFVHIMYFISQIIFTWHILISNNLDNRAIIYTQYSSTKHQRNMVSQTFCAHIYNIDILLVLIFKIWFQTIIYILWTHICYTHSEFKQIHFNWVISQWCTRFISGYLVMISHLLT